MKEIWAQYRDTSYEISNLGQARRNGKTLKPILRPDGYLQLGISTGGKVVTTRIHRMVAETFLGEVIHPIQVNHRNGDKTDNRLINLELCTPQENSLHAREILQRQIGSQRKQAVLTEDTVLEMRQRYVVEKSLTQRQLADEYGVSLSTVNMALHGKRIWRHI